MRPCPTPPRAQAPGSASVGLSSASGEKRPAAEAVRAFYERVNRVGVSWLGFRPSFLASRLSASRLHCT